MANGQIVVAIFAGLVLGIAAGFTGLFSIMRIVSDTY